MPKHYAISDIHGMYNIYEQVCALLQPDDVVYFLGDAGDRGYAGFKCIKAIYNNPQWIYLKGNHEDMMEKALRENTDSYAMETWFYNGGEQTFDEWLNDGRDSQWLHRLSNLPIIKEYTNPKGITFHMSHAGYTCGYKNQMWGNELIWSRDHFSSSWDEETYPKDICIHGHTPISSLVKHYLYHIEPVVKSHDIDCPIAYTYCNGHKIDIDNGVFFTKAAILYDLDEMKSIQLFDNNTDWMW